MQKSTETSNKFKLVRNVEYKNHTASIMLEETGGWMCDWIYGCHNIERVVLKSEFLNCKSPDFHSPEDKEIVGNIYERYFKQVIDGL
jgi:hypothetical protein